jgi:DMSO/TMAO reductase YedYZ heme-binding membrane subunit
MSMSNVVPIVLWLGAVALVAWQLLRAWSGRRFAARTRRDLVSATVDAAVMLAVIRAVAPPPGLLSWAWVAAVVALGAGIAGAALRWRRLGWTRPDRQNSERRRAAAVVVSLAYAGLGAVLLVVLA